MGESHESVVTMFNPLVFNYCNYIDLSHSRFILWRIQSWLYKHGITCLTYSVTICPFYIEVYVCIIIVRVICCLVGSIAATFMTTKYCQTMHLLCKYSSMNVWLFCNNEKERLPKGKCGLTTGHERPLLTNPCKLYLVWHSQNSPLYGRWEIL